MSTRIGQLGWTLACGLIFGAGLAVSGMLNPSKVLAFLDLLGAWDPSLAFVMGGALLVAVPAFRFLRRQAAPGQSAGLARAPAKAVDLPLVAGAALFGIGWGIAGYCPGPVIASFGIFNGEAAWFVAAMGFGLWLGRLLSRVMGQLLSRQAPQPAEATEIDAQRRVS